MSSLAPPALVRLHPRLLLARALGVATGALAVFHGWLLWRRLTERAFGEPAVMLRWLAGLALLKALLAGRRLGVSLTRGRKAVTFWLLVLVLHSSAGLVGARSSASPDAAGEPGLVFVLPATVSVAGIALGLVAPLWFRKSARSIDGLAPTGFLPAATAGPAPLPGQLFVLTARPPPVATA